ncbi:nicotinamide-nucleotide adenylyltransferase [Geoglobus ahangari]|uniref:Nicotinamide-nucleotide adenylyltransferase n=1 Tax=Geoglobus ahangari TaxID=113653 RepID=A0A0F7IG06_9EURY|nr:nicotinamide-nucleotide adenylyltransferase [Geoglobus ahangari]AKG92477.1 nicotinamide-nucleotide adenylyltransferase [Geoglobus ahangari]
MRAFFIGRFQPYHLGHHEVLREIFSEVEEVVIGIGSAQESHTIENPFTAGERVMMVDRAVGELMAEVGERKVYIIPLEDVYRNSLWVSHVVSMTPYFNVVYSNNPLVIRLFREAGFEVRKTKLFNRVSYQGTEIRRRMICGERWEDLVPRPVVEVIEGIDGVKRLRDIAGTDV